MNTCYPERESRTMSNEGFYERLHLAAEVEREQLARDYYGDNFEENVLARHRREEAAEESGHCSHWPLHQCCFCDEREDKSYAGLIRHIAAQEAELERRHNIIAELLETNGRLEAHFNGCPYNGMEWWLGDES